MKRIAHAVWEGALNTGRGHLTTDSKVLEQQRYSFSTRFGDERGTNPEELVAAAHAGCFSMALTWRLGKSGFVPEQIRTTAELTMLMANNDLSIPNIHLRVTGRVPNISAEEFQTIAEEAKATCLISRVLNTEITLEATLE